MTCHDNSIYEGEWNNNKPDGLFIIKSQDNIYEALFINGILDTKGKIIYEDGSIYEGSWTNNVLYDGTPHGYGKKIYADDSVYIGEWDNNKRMGQGKYINSNGDIFEGIWENDIFIK